MTNTKDKQVVVRMPTALYESLKRRAEESERTVAQVMRLAVRTYLGDQEADNPGCAICGEIAFGTDDGVPYCAMHLAARGSSDPLAPSGHVYMTIGEMFDDLDGDEETS